ncbi:YqcC family protein [Shewanella cyperi]|uniref:YqcC family protein n=1 Tax=Shewanella cyperi TaxID=2814292 RepID=UPI001D1828FA|nr:YqcC family protein [Shewanella cyperi]
MHLELSDTLVAIELEMKKQQLWSPVPPSEEALSSTAPFACDTMPLELWLQYILLPRLHYLLDKGLALPEASAVAPMAELVWQEMDQYNSLVSLLRQLDEQLSGRGQ